MRLIIWVSYLKCQFKCLICLLMMVSKTILVLVLLETERNKVNPTTIQQLIPRNFYISPYILYLYK